MKLIWETRSLAAASTESTALSPHIKYQLTKSQTFLDEDLTLSGWFDCVFTTMWKQLFWPNDSITLSTSMGITIKNIYQ